MLLDLVLLDVKFLHFECHHVLRIWILWGSQINQLQVSNSLSKLSSVLHVHPAYVVDDLLGCLDELVWVPFSGCIIDEAFK